LLCAIPYTGWLVGYFVSARMLWRVPWMLPIGLICFLLLKELFIIVGNKLSAKFQLTKSYPSILNVCIPVVCILLVGYFSEFVYPYEWLSSKSQLIDYRNSLTRLANLGNYLEARIDQPSRFIAPSELMNYLPGISSKSKVVLMRNISWTPYPINLNDIKEIFSENDGISMQQRVQILEKYNIQYILTEDTLIKDYYIHNSNVFSAQNFDDYWIIKFGK
jgi:hypothetical protein